MSAVIARQQASNCTNPLLDLYVTHAGVLTNVTALEFQIFDISDHVKFLTPVQVYPVVVGNRQGVNLTACPTGDRVSTGRYVANWSPPVNEPIGLHEIRWFFKLTPTGQELTSQEQFDVIVDAVGRNTNIGSSHATGVYALVSDVRAEGVSSRDASDSRIVKILRKASRMIDMWTGQYFEPRMATHYFDGNGGHRLFLHIPIIGVDSIGIQPSVLNSGEETAVSSDIYRVYNRHLSQGIVQTDDRKNPMIELIHGDEIKTVYDYNRTNYQTVSRGSIYGYKWPRGQQNIRVTGVFGYTDPDGTATGTTPEMIRDVCLKLVLRELPLMSDTNGREDARSRYTLTSERTRDQSYTLGPSGRGAAGGGNVQGPFTGDWDIDEILMNFRRVMKLGSA